MGIHSTKSLTHCLAFPTRSLPGRCILIMQVLELFPRQIWCFSSWKGKSYVAHTNNSIVLCNVMGKLGLCGHTSSPISGWWEKSGKGVSQASAAQVHVLPVLPELHYPRLEDTSLVKPPPLLPPFSNHFLDPVSPPTTLLLDTKMSKVLGMILVLTMISHLCFLQKWKRDDERGDIATFHSLLPRAVHLNSKPTFQAPFTLRPFSSQTGLLQMFQCLILFLDVWTFFQLHP